jgi:hypothetical protein
MKIQLIGPTGGNDGGGGSAATCCCWYGCEEINKRTMNHLQLVQFDEQTPGRINVTIAQ